MKKILRLIIAITIPIWGLPYVSWMIAGEMLEDFKRG